MLGPKQMRDLDQVRVLRTLLREAREIQERGGETRDIPVVLVGEDNPHDKEPFFDLYDVPVNSAGARLRTKILGCSRAVYFGPDVHRANLCRGKWSAPKAREEAARLARLHPTATFVLLGKKVRDAFGIYQLDGDETIRVIRGKNWVSELVSQPRTVVLLPHPSGRCRAWNEPGAIERARWALRDAGLGWLLGGES
jgi:hypothetical protein